jgi:hypothetical protein
MRNLKIKKTNVVKAWSRGGLWGFLAFLLIFAFAAAAPGAQLSPSSLSYQGAFRLPGEFNWGARGMAYYPQGNGGAGSLLIIGFDLNQAEFAEVSIPTPSGSRDWQALPEAAILRGMINFDGSIVESISTETAVASGIEIVPRQGSQGSDKLYGSIDQWYGVTDATHPTIWFAEMDGSNPRGPFHVGPQALPFHGNKAGDFLFSVPQWYANQYLGGRFLVTGKTRGAFDGSQGPTLIAFRPWDNENPGGDLDAVMMLYYRINYPGCAGPNVGDKSQCDYPDFTMCDKWEGGAFLESGNNRAIILLGQKGLGSNFYGDAPGGTCEDSRGYHCDPYERQVIFFDVDELGQVAQGAREPWSVRPYNIWRPGEFLSNGNTCGQVGGVTVDYGGRRLFMIEKGMGGHQNENGAVVHVWSIN